jgi:hypothetical protein
MKGSAELTFVHFRGNTDDWILFIDDVEQYNEWKQTEQAGASKDDADAETEDAGFVVPLFVTGKDEIFITHKHGAQGKKDVASKVEIAAEFGTENRNVAIKQILLQGNLMESKLQERQGSKNDSIGAMSAH